MAFKLISTSGSGGDFITNGNFASGWPSNPTIANADFTTWPSTQLISNGDFSNWATEGSTNLLTNGDFGAWNHQSLLRNNEITGWSPQEFFFNRDFSGSWASSGSNVDLITQANAGGGHNAGWLNSNDLTGWSYGPPLGYLFQQPNGYRFPSHTNTVGDIFSNYPAQSSDSRAVHWYFKLHNMRKIGNKISGMGFWMKQMQDTYGSNLTRSWTTWNPRIWLTDIDPTSSACKIDSVNNLTGNTDKRDADSLGGTGSSLGTGSASPPGDQWLHSMSGPLEQFTTTKLTHWVVMTLPRDVGDPTGGSGLRGSDIWASFDLWDVAAGDEPEGWTVSNKDATNYIEDPGTGVRVQTSASPPTPPLAISQAWGGQQVIAGTTTGLYSPTVMLNGYMELTVDYTSTTPTSGTLFEVYEKDSDTLLGTIPAASGNNVETITFHSSYTASTYPSATEAIEFRFDTASSDFIIHSAKLKPREGKYPLTGPSDGYDTSIFPGTQIRARLMGWGEDELNIVNADDDGYFEPTDTSTATYPTQPGSEGMRLITGSAGTTNAMLTIEGYGGSLTVGSTYTFQYEITASDSATSNALKFVNGTQTEVDLSGVVGTHKQGFVFSGDPIGIKANATSATIELDNLYIYSEWTAGGLGPEPNPPPTGWRLVADQSSPNSAHYCIDDMPDGTRGALYMKRADSTTMKLLYDGAGTNSGDLAQFNYTIPSGATTSGTLEWISGGAGGTAMTNSVGTHSEIAATNGSVFKLGFSGTGAGETTLDDLELIAVTDLQDWGIKGTISATNYIFPATTGGLGFISGVDVTLYVWQTDVLNAGTMYRLVYDITEYTSGQPSMWADYDGTTAEDASRIDLATSVSTDNEVFFKAGDAGFAIGKKYQVAADFALDNVRVYEATPTSWDKNGSGYEGEEGTLNAWVESPASGGKARCRGGKTGDIRIAQAAIVASDTLYKFNYTISSASGLTTGLKLTQSGSVNYATGLATTDGTHETVFDSGTTTGRFGLGKYPDSATTADYEVDGVSLEILAAPDDWTVANTDVDNFVERDGSANQIRFVGENAPGTALTLTQSAGLVMGQEYRLSYTVAANDGAATSPLVWNLGSTTQALDATTAGNYSVSVVNPAGTGATDFILENAAGAGAVDAVISNLSLRRDLGEIELPNPEFGNLEIPRRLQVGSESLGGEFFVYDRGAEVKEYNFSWNALNKTQLDNVFAFWEQVKGMKTTFDITFDDWRPTEFGGTGGVITIAGVRFATSSLEFDELANGQFSLSMVLRDS